MTKAKAIIIGAVIALLLLVGFIGFSFYRSMTAPPALEQVRLPESEELYDVPDEQAVNENETDDEDEASSVDEQDNSNSDQTSSATEADQEQDALKQYQQSLQKAQAKDPSQWTEEDKQLLYGINRELLTSEQREALYGPSPDQPTAIDTEKVLAEQQAQQSQTTVELQGEVTQVGTDFIVVYDGARDWTIKSTKPWVWKLGDVVHCTGIINGDVIQPTNCVLV